jgi:hypothetical protein
MPLSAAHLLHRAEEARTAAQLCRDPELRRLLHDIAHAFEDLADEDYLSARGSACVPGKAVR